MSHISSIYYVSCLLKNRFFNDNLLSMKNLKSGVFFIFCLFFFGACSLNYNSNSEKVSQSPEFVFSNPRYTRINQGTLELEVQAEKIEQYTFDKSTYASNVDFNLYNKDSEKVATGKCNLISANLEAELYYLFDSIFIKSLEKKITIKGEAIKWDNKSQQLLTGFKNQDEEQITVVSEDSPAMKVTGYGFSASGKDNSFAFTGEVSGEIVTKN